LSSTVHAGSSDAKLTIACWGLATFDCLAGQKVLKEKFGVESEIVQIRELDDLSIQSAVTSSEKTGRLLVAANSWGPASFAASVASGAAIHKSKTKISIGVINYPHSPEPTALPQLRQFHLSVSRVVNSALEILGIQEKLAEDNPIDQPQGFNFGPF
jgi:pyruvate/2-oxoglutarate/acetoin dehydrogenase E1 component